MTGWDRGVSDTLGYALVFAIITITIGLVYGSGMVSLTEVQRHEQINNVELGFEVFDDNMMELTDRNAQGRTTELNLAGGSISVGEPILIYVKTNSTEPVVCNETRPAKLSVKPIIYQNSGQSVVYSMSAVFRGDGTGSTMVNRPDWVIGSDQSILPIVTTTTSGSTSVGGDLSILIAANQRGKDLRCEFEEPASPLQVNVTIESNRAPAWKTYFEDQGYQIESSGNDRVVAKFNTSQFYLTDTSVEIEFVT